MGKQKYKPIIGTKYGKWTVISDKIYRGGNQNRSSLFMVQCECGKKARRTAYTLEKGITQSCKSCNRTIKGNDPFISSYLNRVKNRAKSTKKEFNLTVKYVEELYLKQNKQCALSGECIEFLKSWKKNLGYNNYQCTASLDRIDSSKGYIKGNVQWVHKEVNWMKNALDEARLLELCKKIISYSNR